MAKTSRRTVPPRGRRGAAVRSSSAATRAPIRYLETSAIVAALLERDAAARAAPRAAGHRVTSALTLAEAARAIVRARATGRITAAEERAAVRSIASFARRCDVVAVTESILTRVGRPFPVEPIRTLDAVHLATAELLDEPPQLVTIVTRDTRVRHNARALGYAIE